METLGRFQKARERGGGIPGVGYGGAKIQRQENRNRAAYRRPLNAEKHDYTSKWWDTHP